MNTNTCGFSWASICSIIYHLSGHPGKTFGIGLAQMHMIGVSACCVIISLDGSVVLWRCFAQKEQFTLVLFAS